VVICLERGANDLYMVQLMPLPPNHLLLHQNLAYPGCPGKEPAKRLSVFDGSEFYTDLVPFSVSLPKLVLRTVTDTTGEH